MQIEVVDDCSTDGDMASLVKEYGMGIVGYYRKDRNMGSLRNFETCINRSRGQLVHILHGDDFILDGFYDEIESLYKNYPEIGAAFTDFYFVDEDDKVLYNEIPLATEPGVLKDGLMQLAIRQRIQPPSIVVRRSVYEHLGAFFAVKYGEDWEMWVRIAAHYPIAHSPRYLACYREHFNNITTNSFATGQNINDIITVINIIQGYLNEGVRKKVMKESRRNFAIYYAWVAHKMYHDHKNFKGGLQQSLGALKLDVNRTTLLLALKYYVKLLIGYKQK